MDGAQSGQESTTTTVRRLRNPRIGFVGKRHINAEEEGTLFYIGRCIAKLGHTLVTIPTEGSVNVLREGVKTQGGLLDDIKSDVLGSSDHTWFYIDTPLLKRLHDKYGPHFERRDDVLVLDEPHLAEWLNAVKQTMLDSGVTPP